MRRVRLNYRNAHDTQRGRPFRRRRNARGDALPRDPRDRAAVQHVRVRPPATARRNGTYEAGSIIDEPQHNAFDTGHRLTPFDAATNKVRSVVTDFFTKMMLSDDGCVLTCREEGPDQ